MTQITRMPESEYHSRDEVSSTMLRRFDRSPAHMMTPVKRTKSMILGSLVHAMVLTPDEIELHFAQKLPDVEKPDGCDFRKKEWKEWRDGADGQAYLEADEHTKAANAELQRRADETDFEIVSESTWKTAEAMARRVKEHPIFEKLNPTRDQCEVSIVSEFTSPRGRIKGRCRFDMLVERTSADIKCTVDASPESFMRSVIKFGYHVQFAFYNRLHIEEHGVPLDEWYFIAVEAKSPIGVAVYTLPPEAKRAGDEYLNRIMPEFSRWYFDDYPNGIAQSYSPIPQALPWPRWAGGYQDNQRETADETPYVEEFDDDDDEGFDFAEAEELDFSDF